MQETRKDLLQLVQSQTAGSTVGSVIVSPFFTLTVEQEQSAAYLRAYFPEELITTRLMPTAQAYFKEHFPNVFLTKCFNDYDLTFEEEIVDTEIAHLLEHIILQLLCELKMTNGYTSCQYDGLTSWNWVDQPRGTFEIKITIPRHESDLLTMVLPQAVKLLDSFLQHTGCQPLGTPSLVQMMSPASSDAGLSLKTTQVV